MQIGRDRICTDNSTYLPTQMKTSQTIAISATISSAFLIGMNHAPKTTYAVFSFFALTAVIAISITFGIQLIREMTEL